VQEFERVFDSAYDYEFSSGLTSFGNRRWSIGCSGHDQLNCGEISYVNLA